MTLRTAVPTLLLAALLALGWNAVSARAAGDDDPTKRLAAAEGQLKVLRAQVDYLLSREAGLTKYVLSLNVASQGLKGTTGQARTEGFELAAFPAASRVTLLRGVDQFAHDLATGLPMPTRAEDTLKQQADALRKDVEGR